ncbi:MAG: 4'-phosphopantetheinyl transferase superfamily protein [Nitrospira sp.]|nr:4'-phosphopantetheinyl transferase superfamily protein [Nitrospira sp.]
MSPDEQERAQRFKSSQHRRRFTAARGILRDILARYLRQSPRDIHVESGPFGKPFLQDPAGQSLHFNVSHSRQWAVYAVSRDLEVGIDLEEDRDSLDYAGLAERICSADELITFQKLPQAEQRTAFFRCWTRKEAFVKALGHGFSFPLQNVTVTFTSDDPPRILNLQRNLSGTGSPSEDWSLFNLPLGQGFLGALAVAGKPSLVRGWDYDVNE